MACSEGEKYLDRYLLGELAQREAARFEGHLSGCEECSREAALFERTSRLLDSVSLPTMSREFWENQRMNILRSAGQGAVWEAPAYSILCFSTIVVVYLFLGLDGFVLALGDILGAPGTGPANPACIGRGSFDTNLLLYAGILSLAVFSFLSDTEDGDVECSAVKVTAQDSCRAAGRRGLA